MEAKPSCRHISCPRIAQAIIDFISAKHVGSTAMGPTKSKETEGEGGGEGSTPWKQSLHAATSPAHA
jgi:hypothetical protein